MGDGGLINGGYFVLSPQVIDLIDGDASAWEDRPVQRLIAQNQLMAWQHTGFWRPMDTLRDKMTLEDLWSSGQAPWKTW
jgi:glucose-1-phosphate cytidylyltransferase